jgi:hypothetical protein
VTLRSKPILATALVAGGALLAAWQYSRRRSAFA